MIRALLFLSVIFLFVFSAPGATQSQTRSFQILETTIEQSNAAYKTCQLTSRQLVQSYLNRIQVYEQHGRAIKSIITLNAKALEESDCLVAAFKTSGFVGPL